MTEPEQRNSSQFEFSELKTWQQGILDANRHNILCHCRHCDREWIASSQERCQCGSLNVEYVCCWQFPDD